MSKNSRVSADNKIHLTPVDNKKFSSIIQPKLISKNFLTGILISSILIGSVLTLGGNSLVGAQTLKEQTTVKQAAVPKIVNISTVVNNKKQSYSQPSVVYNGKLMVPVKSIASTYKATFKYVSKTKKTTVIKGNTKVILTTGSAVAMVNGKSFKLPQKVVTINGAVMAPAEFLKKLNSHTTTNYNSKTKTFKINTAKKTAKLPATVNGIKVKYGNHTYESKNQKEYDKVMSIVNAAVKMGLANNKLGGAYSEYFYAYLNGERHNGDRMDVRESNIGLGKAQAQIGALAKNKVSTKEIEQVYKLSDVYKSLTIGKKDPNGRSNRSAYDALTSNYADCDSTSQVFSAVFDSKGYDTAIIANSNHASPYIKIDRKWYSYSGGDFTQVSMSSDAGNGYYYLSPSTSGLY